MPKTHPIRKCLETLASLSGFHIAELWTQDITGLNLVHAYVDERLPAKYVDVARHYHAGEHENGTTTNMCKRAMQSKHGFYWIARERKNLHSEIPVHTAVSHYLPRDNVNGDAFIVLFSLSYIKVSVYEMILWLIFFIF
jgi:hypothetical protein